MKKKELKKANSIIISLLILIILGGGIIVLKDYINETKNKYTYKGISGEAFNFEIFKIENNTWHKIKVYTEDNKGTNEFILSFHYSPYEVEDISMEENIKNKVLKNWIYLTQDPELMNKTDGRSLLALLEIGRITGTSNYGIFQINTQAAYTKEAVSSVPIKTCKNANNKTAVIEAKLGDNTSIYSEGECVIVQGINKDGIVMAADKLTYHLLGLF